MRYQKFNSRNINARFGFSHRLVLKEDSSWRTVNGVFWCYKRSSYWLTFGKDK